MGSSEVSPSMISLRCTREACGGSGRGVAEAGAGISRAWEGAGAEGGEERLEDEEEVEAEGDREDDTDDDADEEEERFEAYEERGREEEK